jgi:hypothetical protein
MQLVRIAGPTDAMRRLAEVDGLDFERTSASRLDDDTWQVAGYATDEALAEIERRGLTAELVVGAAELSEQRATVFAAITRDEPPAGPGESVPPGGEAGASAPDATPDDAAPADDAARDDDAREPG